MKKAKGTVFVEHIEKHLKEMDEQDLHKSRGYTLKNPRQVICKICDLSVDEIYEEWKKKKETTRT